MKKFRLISAALLVALPVTILVGCGGGGSSGGNNVSPTAAPTPRPTATLGGLILVVQLRDGAGQPVDGIVKIGTTVANTTVVATLGGNATFNRNVVAGATAVSAEVDGVVTMGSATVSATGSTIYTLTIAPSVTPIPTATLPPPPF